MVTLGCPIAETAPGAEYHQYLGLFDALGQLNSGGIGPIIGQPTWHSTNPCLSPAMPAGLFAKESAGDIKPISH